MSVDYVHCTVESSHAGPLEDLGPALQSVRAIADVITSVHAGTPLRTR